LRRADFHNHAPVVRLKRLAEPGHAEELRRHGCIYGNIHRRKNVPRLILASLDGSVGYVYPLGERQYKRLDDIATEMINRLEHPAGLNPRSYRFANHLLF
jgi:cleavage and polyadenylation specificity factor subunit 1